MEMDLRLILLVVGGLIIGSIILDGMRRRRKGQSKEKLEGFEQTILEKAVDPLQDPLLEGYFTKPQSKPTKVIKEDKSNLFSEAEQITVNVSAQVAPIEVKVHHARMNDMPEEVIALTLIPKQGRGFSGRSLLSILQSNEMYYGDKAIFHRYISQDGAESIAFSLAAMTEPGNFDLQKISQSSYPGLMIFMVLPGPYDPLMTFEQMLSTARQVASSLGGELCDAKRSNLTIQTIEHNREQVREFMRRRLAQQR
jgi:cell division protein ZipA